ncbi:MAG: aerotolerance regulator BatA, partial [Saprospiraceae bacterium]|nr:aerotolerance regulator BatA [Saprospiraceae bacterium]
EQLLREIAEMTGGQYFRATSEESLKQIYQQIDRMEKTKIEVTSLLRYSEEFGRFAMWALILLVLEISLRYTILRAIP